MPSYTWLAGVGGFPERFSPGINSGCERRRKESEVGIVEQYSFAGEQREVRIFAKVIEWGRWWRRNEEGNLWGVYFRIWVFCWYSCLYVNMCGCLDRMGSVNHMLPLLEGFALFGGRFPSTSRSLVVGYMFPVFLLKPPLFVYADSKLWMLYYLIFPERSMTWR